MYKQMDGFGQNQRQKDKNGTENFATRPSLREERDFFGLFPMIGWLELMLSLCIS